MDTSCNALLRALRLTGATLANAFASSPKFVGATVANSIANWDKSTVPVVIVLIISAAVIVPLPPVTVAQLGIVPLVVKNFPACPDCVGNPLPLVIPDNLDPSPIK